MTVCSTVCALKCRTASSLSATFPPNRRQLGLEAAIPVDSWFSSVETRAHRPPQDPWIRQAAIHPLPSMVTRHPRTCLHWTPTPALPRMNTPTGSSIWPTDGHIPTHTIFCLQGYRHRTKCTAVTLRGRQQSNLYFAFFCTYLQGVKKDLKIYFWKHDHICLQSESYSFVWPVNICRGNVSLHLPADN